MQKTTKISYSTKLLRGIKKVEKEYESGEYTTWEEVKKELFAVRHNKGIVHNNGR